MATIVKTSSGTWKALIRKTGWPATAAADLCQRRFETAPGQQSQIDWGQAGICLRSRHVVLHIFVMTLGYSRRGYYRACANEQLGLTRRRNRSGG